MPGNMPLNAGVLSKFGISEYTSVKPLKRVNGFIKYLPSDFQVNEIDLSGNVLEVDEFIDVEELINNINKARDSILGHNVFQSNNWAEEFDTDLFTEHDKNAAISLINELIDIFNKKNAVSHFPHALLKGDESIKNIKEYRKKIHEFIRQKFPFLNSAAVSNEIIKKLNSENLDNHESPVKWILLYPHRSCMNSLGITMPPELGSMSKLFPLENQRKEQSLLQDTLKQIRVDNPSLVEKNSYFLTFNILKINKDTSEVADMLAKCLRRPSKHISFAGTKDKRAITVQKFSIKRVKLEELLLCMSYKLWDRNVFLSNFEYSEDKVGIGDLYGNQFKIAVRGIDSSDIDIITQCINNLKEGGFVNYFGMQRFGTFKVRTHMVGAAIIAGKYEEAIRLILGDITLAERYPSYTGDGLGLNIEYLKSGDIDKSLEELPSHMYLERNVLKNLKSNFTFQQCLEKIPRNMLTLYIHAAQALVFNFIASKRIKMGLEPKVGDLVLKNGEDDVQLLQTEEDCQGFSIDDVVLPLPGSSIIYPPNLVGYYEEVCLEQLGTDFNTKAPMFNMKGSYRHLIARPIDLEYSITEKLKAHDQVILSSDVINKYIKKRKTHEAMVENLDFQDKLAIIISCKLKKSSYMTMALREIFNSPATIIQN